MEYRQNLLAQDRRISTIKKIKLIISLCFLIPACAIFKKNPKLQYKAGHALLRLNHLDKAYYYFQRAVENNPQFFKAYSRLGDVMLLKGQTDGAIEFYDKAIAINPDHIDSCVNLAHTLLPGATYEKSLLLLHKFIKPAAYLEIGVQAGKSIAVVDKNTIAVGVDPEPKISYPITDNTKIFAVTSDKFFEDFDVKKELGSDTVDFSFIDGLHTFEQVLKDFINVEKYSRNDTVVCIHDCLPLNNHTSRSQEITSFWTGDVWKIVQVLKKYRADLNYATIAAPPSGLGLVTNLDPKSTILSDNFDKIISEFRHLDYNYGYKERLSAFNVIENDWEVIKEHIKSKSRKPSKAA